MTQRAVVDKTLENGFAQVTVLRQSACGHSCHDCGGVCSNGQRLSVRALNRAGAAAGDSVLIETESSKIIGAAALVYLLPIIVCLTAYFAASALGGGESVCAFICVSAFVLSALAVSLINRFIRRDKSFEYVIVDKD